MVRSIDPSTGGPVFAVMQMAKAMSEFGYTIDIATTESTESQSRMPPRVININDRVRCIVFQKQYGETWCFSLNLWMWLRRNIMKYDVVHITGIFTFPVLIAAYTAKKEGIPYIIRPAGTLDVYPMAQKSFRKNLYYKIVIEGLVRGAAAIHVTSKKEQEQIGLIGIKEKCFIVPLGIDTCITEKSIKKNDYLKILFLSRIHPKKGLPVLLEAVSLLTKKNAAINLTIAGNGSEKYLRELNKLINNLGLIEAVNFTGFVEGKKKSQLFEEADIFVLPSYQENFGIAVVEALAAGLPVIISDQVAISDDVLEAEAGHAVPVDRPEELANAINSYTKYENRKLASKKAINLVQKKFSLSVLQKNLHSLYCKISGSTGDENG